MAFLTAEELERKIRVLLNDDKLYDVESNSLHDGGWFDSAMIIDSINYACREYVKRKRVTLTSTAAQISSSGLISIPSDSIDIRQVSVGNKALLETSFSYETISNPEWEVLTGTETLKWMIYDGLYVKLTPILTAWGLGPYNALMLYMQEPKTITTLLPVTAGNFVVGTYYEIISPGTTTWANCGASASTAGTQFKATGAGSGTGTAYEVIDWRIRAADQDSLKYMAASFLVDLKDETGAKREQYESKFNTLVGVL